MVASPPAEVEQRLTDHPFSSTEPTQDLKEDIAAVLPGSGTSDVPADGPGEEEELSARAGDSGQGLVSKSEVSAADSAPVVTEEPNPTLEEIHKDSAGLDSSYDFSTSSLDSRCDPDLALAPADKLPEEGPQSGTGDPASTASSTGLELSEECPLRPNTLDFSNSLRFLEETKQTGQRQNSDHSNIQENGVESCPEAAPASEEQRALESELEKCIEDFRKIKIPISFPNKKWPWQSELLKKYQV
ncbi:uncharacterized protein LOC142020077 [Carettochelys insculpta]|uniref:uncharacterized protein LOC142020077 n=1 Tax=Carettochelys insculpta TaxID=44489 RepID=UPI003EBDDE43